MSEALVGRTLERSRSPGRNPPSSAGLREGRHPVEMGAGYTGEQASFQTSSPLSHGVTDLECSFSSTKLILSGPYFRSFSICLWPKAKSDSFPGSHDDCPSVSPGLLGSVEFHEHCLHPSPPAPAPAPSLLPSLLRRDPASPGPLPLRNVTGCDPRLLPGQRHLILSQCPARSPRRMHRTGCVQLFHILSSCPNTLSPLLHRFQVYGEQEGSDTVDQGGDVNPPPPPKEDTGNATPLRCLLRSFPPPATLLPALQTGRKDTMALLGHQILRLSEHLLSHTSSRVEAGELSQRLQPLSGRMGLAREEQGGQLDLVVKLDRGAAG
ncbi:hypothetical protein CB1_000518021 [Camelus ferus]|nr:hypothetical protein CB1_000518021 [Camelus ferus]